MRASGPWWVGAIAGACASAGVAQAATPARPLSFDVVVDGCPDIAAGELRRLLSVELAGHPVAPVAYDEARRGGVAHPDRIAVNCAGSNAGSISADIAVSGEPAGPTTRRHIELADVPPLHRPRVVAIAVVALMADAIDTPTPPDSTPSRLAPPPSDAAPAIARAATLAAEPDSTPRRRRAGQRRWRVSAAASTVGVLGLDTFLWGASGGAHLDMSPHFGGEIDVLSAANSVAIPFGRADVLVVAFGAAAVAHVALGRFAWDAGVGARAGIAQLTGIPASGGASDVTVHGKTVVEPWGGPFAMSRLCAQATREVSVLLGVEGGYSPATIVGRDGATEVALGPLWLGLSLGLGWSP